MPPQLNHITIVKKYNEDSDEEEYYKIYKKPYYTLKTIDNPKLHIYQQLRCDCNGKLLNKDGTTKIRKIGIMRKPRNDKGRKFINKRKKETEKRKTRKKETQKRKRKST